MSEANQSQENETSEHIAKKILSSLRKNYAPGEDTLSWLKNMSEDVPVKFHEGNLYAVETQAMTMPSIIDKLFDDFQRYAYEFNLDASEESMIQRCERQLPNAARDKAYGYLATLNWAIIIQGEKATIRAFLVPMRSIKDFYLGRHRFKPLMEMQETRENGDVVWKVEEVTIHAAELPIIDKKLFARLVRVVRGQTTDSEPFHLNLDAAHSAGATVPGKLSPSSETTGDFPIIDLEEEIQSQPDVEERVLASSQHGEDTRSAASLKLLGSVNDIDDLDMPSESLFLVKPKTNVEMLNDSHTSTLLAIASVVRSIDEDLIMFSHAAVKALRNGDMQGVQRIMKRCQNLRDFREKAAGMAEEWNDTVTGETPQGA